MRKQIDETCDRVGVWPHAILSPMRTTISTTPASTGTLRSPISSPTWAVTAGRSNSRNWMSRRCEPAADRHRRRHHGAGELQRHDDRLPAHRCHRIPAAYRLLSL
jgi:hypothetical protein